MRRGVERRGDVLLMQIFYIRLALGIDAQKQVAPEC